MSRSLAGKVAVITGGGAGIGQAYAKRLAQDGADIAIADRDAATETVSIVEGLGRRAFVSRCDVSSQAEVIAFAKDVESKLGRCDILVNNAGIYPVQPFDDISFDDWKKVLSVNLDGPFLTIKAFAPGMRKRKWGRIINQASDVFALVLTGFTHYTASKGGVIGLTRAAATEFANDGVTVNAIAPGLVRTPGTSGRKNAPGGLDSGADEFSVAASHQAIKRSMKPEDLVGTLSYLASDDSEFITGQTFYVNGGHVRT